MDEYKPYKPPGFRPTSLSIVTVTPEIQKSLQDLRNSSNSTLENIFSNEDDEDDYDDHEENTRSTDRINEDDTDEDDEDENQFYYKTPGKQFKVSNGGPKMSPGPLANGVEKKLPQNGGTKYESSLIRYVLPQNTLSPLAINFDSVSAASFQSETRKLPSILKQSVSKDDTAGEDNASIGDCSIANQSDSVSMHNEHKQSMQNLMSFRLFKLLSIMYAIMLVVIGGIITLSDLSNSINDTDHVFSIITTVIGMIFLSFIHISVQRHKRFVMNWEKKRKDAIEAPMKQGNVDMDTVSVTTAVIFNRTYMDDEIDEDTKSKLNYYKFLTGKHSGNFYLKIGMTVFCMGSIVHQGINVALQVHFFMQDVGGCKNPISFTVYLIRCIFAFYQLYMAFKYSNLIINRHHYVVIFGLMHLLGTSISFWFSTIIEEAMDGYTSKVTDYHANKTIPADLTFKEAVDAHINCSKNALSNFESLDAMPYLYPFSIEYNIILASVWYIMWCNIGSNDPSQLSHVREEINQNQQTGLIDVNYRSNITINADCHASNLGLFGGLFSLLMVLTTTIVFFTTIKHDEYKSVGIGLYSGQFGFLTLCCLIAVPLAFRHTLKLNVVNHHHLDNSATAMDDLLLLVPLPFFYVHHILCIFSEVRTATTNSLLMAFIYVLHLIQVTVQTPFLVDGIRRCSNERKFRFKKPAKGIITFLIIINVSLYFLVTFEIKSVDKYHSPAKFYGKWMWMIILDTCLPLMLFYRFHSSVCLSDIWKHAYEKDEPSAH